jgi:glycosyltransferase involved in cell wall biosynthesis
VGRIEPEKAPLVAAEALAQLERSDPGRFSLTWVGEGRLSGDLREAAEATGATVSLPGFIPFGPELLELYRGADVFIHTALTEGVPGVLQEAMGAGLPIVATDVGGVRAALADGEAGLLVSPEDPAALADAVRRLDADPEVRRRLSSRALELAAQATLESESERVAAFIATGEAGSSAPPQLPRGQ